MLEVVWFAFCLLRGLWGVCRVEGFGFVWTIWYFYVGLVEVAVVFVLYLVIVCSIVYE